MRKYLHGYSKTHQEKEPSNQTISTTLYRLKKRGLLTKDSETFQTTYQGNKYLDTNNKSLKVFSSRSKEKQFSKNNLHVRYTRRHQAQAQLATQSIRNT